MSVGLALSIGGLWPQKGGGAPVYTPAASAPPLWFEGQTFQDLAGTTPTTTAGQTIALQKNRGTTASTHDVSRSASGSRPTLSVVSPPTVTFDGVDDYLTGAGTGPAVTGAQVLVSRFKLNSASGYQTLIHFGQAGAFVEVYVSGDGSGYPFLSIHMGASGTSAGVGVNWARDTSWHTLAIEFNGGAPNDPAAYAVKIDGVVQTLGTCGAMYYQQRLCLGAEFDGNRYNQIDGSIRSLVYLDRAYANAAERANLTAYEDAL